MPPETVVRAADGSVKITSQLGPVLAKRKGYETKLLSAEKAGIEIVDGQKWERAHSQGRITGHESEHGIVYAPFEVNRKYQEHGIEAELQQMHRQKAPDVEFELETVTECHPTTRRLSRIQYKVTAIRDGVRTLVFERALNVGNQKSNPTVTGEGPGILNLEPFLKPAALRPSVRARVRSRVNVRGAVSSQFSRALTGSIALAGLSILAGKLREQLEDRIVKRQLTVIEEEINKQISASKVERAKIQAGGTPPNANIVIELVVSRFTDISQGMPVTDQSLPVVTLEELNISQFVSPSTPTKYMKPGGVVRNYFVRSPFSFPVPVSNEELTEYQQLERDLAWCTELLGDSSLVVEDRKRITGDYLQLQQAYAEWQRD